jgi:hypothetical protein
MAVMKTRTYIIILLLACIIPLNSPAQVGSALKKKLEQAVQKKPGTQDEKKADENQQEAENPDEKPAFDMSRLGIGKVTTKYEENYDYKGLIEMRSELYEKGKQKAISDIFMWLDANTNSLGMETTTTESKDGETLSAIVIVDMKNKAMLTYTIIDGAKSGMIMPIPDSLEAETTEVTEELTDKVKIRKTGNTRIILGYRCDEYEVTEEGVDETSNVWTTEDIDFKSNKKLLGGQQGMPKSYGIGQLKGIAMASETYEKGQLTSKMEVTKIDFDATHSISTAGTSLIQMNFLKWGQKKK